MKCRFLAQIGKKPHPFFPEVCRHCSPERRRTPIPSPMLQTRGTPLQPQAPPLAHQEWIRLVPQSPSPTTPSAAAFPVLVPLCRPHMWCRRRRCGPRVPLVLEARHRRTRRHWRRPLLQRQSPPRLLFGPILTNWSISDHPIRIRISPDPYHATDAVRWVLLCAHACVSGAECCVQSDGVPGVTVIPSPSSSGAARAHARYGACHPHRAELPERFCVARVAAAAASAGHCNVDIILGLFLTHLSSSVPARTRSVRKGTPHVL